MILVASFGFLCLALGWALPHSSLRLFLRRLSRRRSVQPSGAGVKKRLDLPQAAELLWRCQIEPKNEPLVVNERVECTLIIAPLHKDRTAAHIDLQVFSTEQLKDVTAHLVAPAFEGTLVGELQQLSLSHETEAIYILTPKQIGQHYVKFEFRRQGELCGIVSRTFGIKSRQY